MQSHGVSTDRNFSTVTRLRNFSIIRKRFAAYSGGIKCTNHRIVRIDAVRPSRGLGARLDIVGEADPSGLPPFTMVTAGIDPRRGDGRTPAERLEAAGNRIRSGHDPGVARASIGMGAVATGAEQAEDAVV